MIQNPIKSNRGTKIKYKIQYSYFPLNKLIINKERPDEPCVLLVHLVETCDPMVHQPAN